MSAGGDTVDAMRRVVRSIRFQLAEAKRAGTDDCDLCIAVPPSYLSFAAGWPTIEIDAMTVALATRKWAEAVVRTAFAEAGPGCQL